MEGTIQLDSGFQKDVNWFLAYLPKDKRRFMMPRDNRESVELFVSVCASGERALCHLEAYHTVLPPRVLQGHHPSCQLEALNAVTVLHHWVPLSSRQAGASQLRQCHGSGHISRGLRQGQHDSRVLN